MNKNKFRYCTLLLIDDDDNNSKIFISEKNKYYIKNNNKSINIKILNEFKDIRKSYGINVIDTTDNCYKINEPSIIKHCTILLIDDYNHSKIFISEKNLYYISYADDDDDDFVNHDNFVDYDFVDYDDDYHDDFIVNYDDLVYYKKPLNCFERLVFVKNNIVNLINNDDCDIKPLLSVKNIALSIDNINTFIYENVY